LLFRVVGAVHHDPLWGKKEDYPDDLDIAGHYRAPEPGETAKERIYMVSPLLFTHY
jgi:hypothetical protein